MKVFLVLAGVLITCYIVAFGLLLGTAVVARVQVGHRLRAPESQTVQHDDAHPGHPAEPV